MVSGFGCMLCWLSLQLLSSGLSVISDPLGTSLPNVAPKGTASQSSSHPLGAASKAIDGNRNPNYFAGFCSHTLEDRTVWWSLLLPATYRISAVSITSRDETRETINNASILIGNDLENNGNNNPRCAVIPSIPAGSTRTFHCGGMIGRLVNVLLTDANRNRVLIMCEVEVYGEPADSASFRAAVMGRSIAVVERKLCWSDALFYCRDFHWDLLSIRSEEEQREVEEVLRTAPFNVTPRVWLGLRRFLMGDVWFWMDGDSMSYTHWETKSIWQTSSPCGGVDASNHFHWADLPCGDHLHFICSTDLQKDTKRVEFFSSTRP